MNDRKDALAIDRRPSCKCAYLPLALIAVLGTSISLVVFVIVQGVEHARVQDEFEQQGAIDARALQQGINNYLEMQHSVRGLYNASHNVDRDQFFAFVANSVHRPSGLQALYWIPRVPHSQRNTYEAAARSEGFSDFAFTERTVDGEVVKAAPREEYFPIYYVEPFEGNRTALGIDVASDPGHWEAMKRARDTGAPVATGRIRIIQEAEELFGFMVFLPIYRKSAAHESFAHS